MRLSSLFYFYRLRLRARWVQELFALIGIAVGVALLFAAQVANTSLTGSVEQLVQGTFGQAQLQVTARAPQGMDERLLERVQRTPGVDVAAPLLEVQANAVASAGREPVTLFGADLNLTDLAGPVLSRFRALPSDRALGLPEAIASRIGASVGAPLRLEIAASVVTARLGAALTERQIGPLTESPLAVGPLAYVQELSGMQGRISRVLIRARPGRQSAVERALRPLEAEGVNVRPAHFDLELFREAAEPTNRSTGMFAVISALVGFLFAFSAMLLTLPERRRLITALRNDGYAPRSIVQVLLFDALVVAVAASACGLLLGDQLSRHVFDAKPGYLSFAFPVGDQRIVEWQSIVIAVAGGIGATLLAALLPLADVLRRPRVERSASTGVAGYTRPLLLAGLTFLTATIVVMVVAPEAALVAIGTLVVALMLMLPALLATALSGAERLLRRRSSAVALISVGELRAMPARSLAVAATGAVAVFGSVSIQGAGADLRLGLDRSAHDFNAVTDIWVSPGGARNMLGTVPFRDQASGTLARLPEVRDVQLYRSSFLDIGRRRAWVVAQPVTAAEPVPPSQLTEGELALATERLRAGGWAVLSEAIARERGLEIGDRFSLPTPRPRTFRLAALSTNIGWPSGAVLISADDYRRAWATTDPSAYHVTLAPGVSPARGYAAVTQALGQTSALSVETSAQREELHRASTRQALSRLDQLTTLVLIAAVLAMGAATAGMIWQRRTRLASLKLDGFDDLTVWRSLLLESVLLLGAGCFAGGLFGLYGQQALDRALESVTGFPVVYSVGFGIAAISTVLVTAVAVAVAALPGYLAARVAPAVALQD